MGFETHWVAREEWQEKIHKFVDCRKRGTTEGRHRFNFPRSAPRLDSLGRRIGVEAGEGRAAQRVSLAVIITVYRAHVRLL